MADTHGGPRPGAGRPKGSREAATKVAQQTIAELAKQHAPMAIEALAQIMRVGESEAARVAAANAILDRAFGKPTQAVNLSGAEGGPLTMITRRIVDPANEP